MNKKIILVLLAILAFSMPALAALEYTTTLLYFNVAQLDEVTVYLLGYTSTGNVTAPAGTATLYNIEFNTTQASASWINATVATGSGQVQSQNSGIIYIDNTGTTNDVQLNISTNVSSWASEGNPAGCLNLKYFANQSLSTFGDAVYTSFNPSTLAQLNVTNVTIDADFDATDQAWEVWLFGNFTNCVQGTYAEMFYVWANFP